jgi:HAE1 family hydrophobic/amphiphilic exporter-1
MGLTKLAVYHPVVILTVVLALVLFGTISYFSLGLELMPKIDLPITTVQVQFHGATAGTVEEQITRRVEDAIAPAGNIKKMTSYSVDGLSTVQVEFYEVIDPDFAAAEVQRRVSTIRSDLPADAEEPSYLKLDLNDTPVMYVAVTSPAGDPVELYRVADDIVRPKIEAAQGVGRVLVVGGQLPEVQVEVDPDKLRAYGLTIDDVSNAVRTQFIKTSGGDVKSGGGGATTRTTLTVDSRQVDLASLGNIIVTSPDGFRTELRNVARVYRGGKPAEQALRVNGQVAAGLLVYKQTGANITKVADAVRPIVEGMADQLPPGYQTEIAIDASNLVHLVVGGVEDELLMAVIIAGIVLYLFLHSPRSTVIVVLAIPTSFLVVMIVLNQMGLTLNTMTLIGMTSAVGVLVDDSIVVLENIFGHLEKDEDSRTAAIKGRSEIGMAAVAITMVDVVVWGPVLFLTGMTGAFLRSFGIVMVSATLTSLLVSFALTPLLASRWLATAHDNSLLARIAAVWEPLYNVMAAGYARTIHWSLGHRPLILLGAGAALSLNFLILPHLGTDYVPEMNRDTVTVIGELPPGTALEGSARAARQWETALLDKDYFPEVETAYILAGRGDSDYDNDPRYISITLDVGETKSRTRKSLEIGKAAIAVGEQIAPGLKARIGGQRSGGTGQPVIARIFDSDLDQLLQVSRTATAALAARPELTYVTNGMVAAPNMTIRPDDQKLKDLGITTQVVGDAIRTAYQGTKIGRWAEASGKERDVRVILPDALRYNPDAVTNLPLIRAGGDAQGAAVLDGHQFGLASDATLVTLRQVTTIVTSSQPTKIERFGRQRVVEIGAEPNDVPLGTASNVATEVLDGLELPAGARWGFGGQGDDQADSFGQLSRALTLSIILMYMVLAILYEDWLQPVLILTALPLASVGAMLGLLGFHQTLNVPAFIGLIALFGMVGKNAILLVDRANELRKEGLERREALEQAGENRFRPILMTSVVLILSMLPVALALGDGGELRASLAAVLVGGMTTSTVLSLVYVPVAYTYFDNLATFLKGLSSFKPHLPFRRGGSGQKPSDQPSQPAPRPVAPTPAMPRPAAGVASSKAALALESARLGPRGPLTRGS